MQILDLLSMHFNAVVVLVKKNSLLFRLALSILCSLSVQCTAQPMHRSAAWLKGGWEGFWANFIRYKM